MSRRNSVRATKKPIRFTEEFKEYDVFSVEHDVALNEKEFLTCVGCARQINEREETARCYKCMVRAHAVCSGAGNENHWVCMNCR